MPIVHKRKKIVVQKKVREKKVKIMQRFISIARKSIIKNHDFLLRHFIESMKDDSSLSTNQDTNQFFI